MKQAILKKGREESVLKGHHWIFSGAFAEVPEKAEGGLFPIMSSTGDLLAHAFLNTSTRTIWGRILSLGTEEPMVALQRLIFSAVERRKLYVGPIDNYNFVVHMSLASLACAYLDGVVKKRFRVL